MNENTSMGMGGYVLPLFVILIVWFFMGGGCGGFGGFGGWGRGNWGACGGASPCEIERQEIIDSATTQFKIVDNARQVQDTVIAGNNMLANKIDFYEYQNLRDQLSQERTKNVVLENRVYADAQFNALTAQNRDMYNALQAQISSINCNMLRKPDITGIGAVCPSAGIINGLGLNSLSQLNCGCGC